MDHNIILEGIKDATTSINNNADFLINHATNQLYYLDELLKNMVRGCGYVVLANETYSNILMLEFETLLLIKAIELNARALTVEETTVEIIKSNCDDLLTKINEIKSIQSDRVTNLNNKDLERLRNGEADIDLGAL